MIEKKEKKHSDVPVASLADIAFLLLVFFLVTTTIDVDMGIGLVLPDRTPTTVPDKNLAKVLVNSAGMVLLDNKAIQLHELHKRIVKRLQDNPNLIISVKTTRKTRYDVFVKILDELKIAEAKRISIAEPE